MSADTTDDDDALPRLLVLRVWARPDGLRAVVRQPGLQCTEVFTEALALCRHVVGAENFERLVVGHGLARRAPTATSARTPEAQVTRGDAVAPLAAPADPHGRAALRHAMRCWQLGMHMQVAGAEQAAPASADDRRAGTRARVLPLRAWVEGEAQAGRPRIARGKVQRRPLDLLDLPVALGGRAPAVQLADRLWLAAEGDRAMVALAIALRRLRKLLGRTDAVLRSGGARSINRRLVWVEALELSPLGHRPPASVPGADMSLRFVPTAADCDGASVGNPSLAADDHGHSRQRPEEGPQAEPDGSPRGSP